MVNDYVVLSNEGPINRKGEKHETTNIDIQMDQDMEISLVSVHNSWADWYIIRCAI